MWDKVGSRSPSRMPTKPKLPTHPRQAGGKTAGTCNQED